MRAAELKDFVREARAMLGRERDLAEFEIYCASAEHRVARLAYTSDIPCRGVEELKSHLADGFTVRIVMRRDAREIGMATEAGDLSLEALLAALERARSAALVDPHFPGLPGTPHFSGLPQTSSRIALKFSHSPADAASGGLIRAVMARWSSRRGESSAVRSTPSRCHRRSASSRRRRPAWCSAATSR